MSARRTTHPFHRSRNPASLNRVDSSHRDRNHVRVTPALRRAGRPQVLVVMGVSGSGKSTIGGQLAEALGWPLVEGDTLHPASNIEKMSAGIPLTDADRRPWLQDVANVIAGWISSGTHGVITCSALKRHYRDMLRAQNPLVCFVYIKGTPAQIAPRLQGRLGHFMPGSLLESQFTTLEEPREDEVVLELDLTASPAALVRATVDVIAGLHQEPIPEKS